MDMMQIIFILVYTAVTVAGLLCFRGTSRASPLVWFLPANWLMAIGTFVLLDTSLSSDVYYGVLYNIAQVSFLGAAVIFYSTHRVKSAYTEFWLKPIVMDPVDIRYSVLILIGLSAFITFIYYRSIGYNIAYMILTGTDIGNYSDARLDAYSGDHYFAPGYVNQFKNVILPATFSVLAATVAFRRKRFFLMVMLIVGLPLLFLALAGTGQRAFVIYSFFAFMFGLSALVRISRAALLAGVAVVTTIMFVMTSSYKGTGDFSDTAARLLGRFIAEQQFGGLIGFRYVYFKETSWLVEWGQNLIGILPGFKGSTLPHEVHQLLYGSDRGTIPLSLVGSAYHNGGVALVVAYFALLGWSFSYLYYRFLLGRRTVFRCFVYGALFFYLAIHVSGTPVSLINNGAVTLLVMLFVRKARWQNLLRGIMHGVGAASGRSAGSFRNV